MSTMRDELAADDGSLPERWNPDDVPGTTLVGTLVRFELIVTKMGEGTIAVIEDADDQTQWGVALFRSVLKNQFEKHEPRPGDTVGIKYIGLVEPRNKNANPYHNYVMRVERNSTAPVAVANAATVIRGPTAAEVVEQEDELPF